MRATDERRGEARRTGRILDELALQVDPLLRRCGRGGAQHRVELRIVAQRARQILNARVQDRLGDEEARLRVREERDWRRRMSRRRGLRQRRRGGRTREVRRRRASVCGKHAARIERIRAAKGGRERPATHGVRHGLDDLEGGGELGRLLEDLLQGDFAAEATSDEMDERLVQLVLGDAGTETAAELSHKRRVRAATRTIKGDMRAERQGRSGGEAGERGARAWRPGRRGRSGTAARAARGCRQER